MLYIACMIILSDHSIRKIICENFDFWATQGEKLHEQVVYPSPGSPPPPPPPGPNTQIRWKTCKYGLKYALHSLSGHFEWSQYQKNKFRKLWFLSCPGWKLHKQVVHQSLGRHPPPRTPNTRIGWKTRKYGLKHALHSLDDDFKWSQYQKKICENFDFWATQGEKLHKQVVYPSLGSPPPPPPRPDLIPK